MALVRCIDCREQISSDARFCPKCGCCMGDYYYSINYKRRQLNDLENMSKPLHPKKPVSLIITVFLTILFASLSWNAFSDTDIITGVFCGVLALICVYILSGLYASRSENMRGYNDKLKIYNEKEKTISQLQKEIRDFEQKIKL